MRSDAPGVLGVNSQALHVLRKTSITSRSGRASHAGRDRRCAGGAEIKEGRIRSVEAGIFRIGKNGFGSGGKRAAEQRLVDKIDAQARGVAAGYVADVVTELKIFLGAQGGENRVGGYKTIGTRRFEAG